MTSSWFQSSGLFRRSCSELKHSKRRLELDRSLPIKQRFWRLWCVWGPTSSRWLRLTARQPTWSLRISAKQPTCYVWGSAKQPAWTLQFTTKQPAHGIWGAAKQPACYLRISAEQPARYFWGSAKQPAWSLRLTTKQPTWAVWRCQPTVWVSGKQPARSFWRRHPDSKLWASAALRRCSFCA